jgi:phosphoglycolate phosphatase
MSKPPILVLDLDGTLVHTAPDLVDTLNRVLNEEGVAPLGYERAIRTIGNGAKVMIEAGLAAQGEADSPARIDQLYARFLAHYEIHMTDRSVPFPGAVAAIDRFAAAGWTLAICTNKLERLSRDLLKRLSIADRFKVIAGQDTFGVRKPDARHLVETIRAAGGEADRAIMVGDTSIDIETAKRAGVRSVAVAFGYSAVPVGELGADAVIEHFDQLFDTAAGLSHSLMTERKSARPY